jgi:hypothetical protein
MSGRKFKEEDKGKRIICVHDIAVGDGEVDMIHSGDRVTFIGYCPGCGGILIKERQSHLEEAHFELYLSQEELNKLPEVALADTHISKQLVADSLNEMSKIFFFNQLPNGGMSVFLVKQQILELSHRLGIQKEMFLNPVQKQEENMKQHG